MPVNVGTVDRAARILIGLGLMAAALTGLLGSWAWIGLVPLATGVAGSCPLYRLAGLNTCGMGRH